MAKELQVPVIALSQLSRSNEKRETTRPHAERSPRVRFPCGRTPTWSPSFTVRPTTTARNYHEEKAEAEIIISKQRNGPTGIIKMHWNSAFTRFDGVASHHEGE